jgi:hypothetical protein
MQDLKTGHLHQASPRAQFMGQVGFVINRRLSEKACCTDKARLSSDDRVSGRRFRLFGSLHPVHIRLQAAEYRLSSTDCRDLVSLGDITCQG